MLSNKPYLIRAFYEWIIDSTCTPFLVINANYPRCNVPQNYVENGEITLNISPSAIRDLKISNDIVEFRASFSGVVHIISAPVKAVLAIYAQENQQGMFFDFDELDDTGDTGGEGEGTTLLGADNEEVTTNGKPVRPHLKLVE